MRWCIGAGVLLGALAVMGCGSAKEKEYRREANAICAAARKRLDELPRPSSLAQVAKVAEREMAIREEVVTDFGELTPPIEISGGVNNVFSDLEARLERAVAVHEAAKHKDRKKLREVRHEGETEFPIEAERARAVGLPACAEV